ncbi:GLABROUS1 enhancer-binding protein-like [Ricinus communis]|uniref:Transcription regulator, putative n=1 Tax=Ricinus communis TaxID=3988 RepID=B9RXV5_RICCO|nr:GLABROUS1 enhancer-binding protein-like [Ricinus communis]EEF43961.1 transcription regulator, putative [Ricinus communis]|eukprot:XP_002518574.1 GLABROUS1 enhancer-binding protein-like [Ricinus communis]
MAPKRSTPLEDPPAASSSEEEEEGTSSGEEEEEEEEEEGSSSEEEQETQKPQTQIVTPKPPPKQPESESESESGSGSETDDDEKPKKAPNSTVKPIASKPMEETPPKTTKPRSKPAPKPTTAAAAGKRASEVDREPKDSKRAKKKDPESDGAVTATAEKSEDTKKQLFQRLWSEDDEIVVLKGIIDFIEKKGVDPAKDIISFFDYIKKSLHFDVSLNQLKDKIWRLKKKFENNVKGKKGEDKTFSKSHDQKSFDLSKKIWGTDGIIGASDSSIKPNGKAKKATNNNAKSLVALKAELGMDVDKENEKVDKMDVELENHSSLKQFDRGVGVSGMEDYVIKRGLDMVQGAKKAEMEEKWRKLHVAELELFLRRNELTREQAKLMLASYKNEQD